MTLSSLLDAPRPNSPFLLLQSSTAQSAVPLLRDFVSRARCCTVLFCCLYPPNALLNACASSNVEVHDRIACVPGYSNDDSHLKNDIIFTVKSILTLHAEPDSGPLNVVIDSLDTINEDIGSVSATYKFLCELLGLIRARSHPSQLVLHSLPCPVLRSLIQPSFSSTIRLVKTHPVALLVHLARSYSSPPPPMTAESAFWGVFLPLSERMDESERLLFGPSPDDEELLMSSEMVLEVLIRSTHRSKGVERTLKGWTVNGPCELPAMSGLKHIFHKQMMISEEAPDPTQNVSFNLNLTPSQQKSRAEVPLPYAHEGSPASRKPQPSSVIIYDPDSADDFDDDDPDEDLDI
ncbi:hypothetical protein FISHEDRAFT_66217 [Fistulina hepatica ATCC 64428]|uniref:Elongator complex protein 5 n=1 Tax=Fistulina hepatica ATCC 64428 TaxID=1128425 RepID=A0A0D7A9G9_9AGAR|nr:hypothetical protein FISHEDRAFT_66217 [Fistulina hepatica ATCC 64428]